MKESLVKRFAEVGLRLKIMEEPANLRPRDRVFGGGRRGFSIDIRERGTPREHFIISWGSNIKNIQVLGTKPEVRHLVLFVETEDPIQDVVKREMVNGRMTNFVHERARPARAKRRFLCGYDEREYFVAALPSSSTATTVDQAFRDLKPGPVLISGGKQSGTLRQGEWFLIPAPNFNPAGRAVLRNEPLVRQGGGKPHMASQLVRTGGKSIKFEVGERLPDGRIATRAQVMTENPDVFITGTLRHPDHKTKKLQGWYRVLANTETSPDGRVMRFFD